MEPKIFGLLVFSVSMGVLGQFFFKTGMKEAGPVEFGPHVLMHFLRPVIIAGITCYGVATTSWLVIISKTPLSLAYPMISISYVIIVLVGRFAFEETVSAVTWLGVALICCGVGCIGYGGAPTRPPQVTAITASPAPPHSP